MAPIKNKADKTKPRPRLIHDVLPENNELLDKVKKEFKTSISNALNIICQGYSNRNNSIENEENEKIIFAAVQQENEKIILEMAELKTLNDQLIEENKGLALQIEELFNTKVKIQETLKGTQFICEPSEKLAENIKKVRRFLKSKQMLDHSETAENFINNLACLALKKYLNNNYSHII